MQNRYTGDIGDFGKLGLLRVLQAAGLSVGVNWYLVPNENHNDDGKFTQYLKLRPCDPELYDKLKEIVDSDRRCVSALQASGLLNAVYYADKLCFSGKTKDERKSLRNSWHQKALKSFAGLDIVFVDPDNGMLVPSAAETKKENKYVTPKELKEYYGQDSSIVYYQHKARKPDSDYAAAHRKLIGSPELAGASGFGLKFTKTSLRYYFFIIQPKHKEVITKAVDQMMTSAWKALFKPVQIELN